mgnify:FL=1
MADYRINTSDELYHHGILGQRWGKRNGPPYPLGGGDHSQREKKHGTNGWSVEAKREANARKAVRKAKQISKDALNKYDEATDFGFKTNKKAEELYRKESTIHEYTKKRYSDIKVENKLKQELKKSDNRLKYEKEYIKQGMSKKEAEIAAYKRERTKKILIATAGLTVAAIGAYAGYKYYQLNVDKVIKAGTNLQNISKFSDKGVEDAFYAAYKSGDKMKYKGLYGMNIKIQNLLSGEGSNVINTSIKVTKDMKIANGKTGEKLFSNLYKNNSDYRDNVNYIFSQWSDLMKVNPGKGGSMWRKAERDLNNGKMSKNVYRAFNTMLVDRSNEGMKAREIFYNELKSKGYDGIMDVNDALYSGYKAKSPVIIFNGANKASVIDHKTLNNVQLGMNYLGAELAISGSTLAALAGGAVTASKMKSYSKSKSVQDDVVKTYRKEHPGSNLSRTEILDNYYGYKV